MLMQIYADVTGREIAVAGTDQATALGAAMLGATAAGKAGGGTTPWAKPPSTWHRNRRLCIAQIQRA